MEDQLRRYQAALEASPIRTQMITAALLAGVGDAIAQRIEGATIRSFAWRRFAALIFVNVVYIVPLLCVLYAANDKLVGERTAKHGEVARTGVLLWLHLPWPWLWLCLWLWLRLYSLPLTYHEQVARTGAMLVVDQLINAPLCILGFYYAFSVSAVLFGADPFPRGAFHHGWAGVWRATNAEVRAKFTETLVKNWQVWVLPQLLNFALVPPKLRLVFANVVALVWNVVISVMVNK